MGLAVKHQFIIHPTYTGKGCAVCGRVKYRHDAALEFGEFRVVITRLGNDAVDTVHGEGRNWNEAIATRYANAVEYLVKVYPELRISKIHIEFRPPDQTDWRRW